ncbi:DNA polymerase IV [Corynebacterium phocae]|uniref:DNA polymerase IV n=1 Tax=Corynebacterium phocae TaxID=161895 RepID=A0A1L7D2M9_9CORY|nr:DNA polymerase IV [Corynebacterium phocae]APT92241.1 DNA polymerase IV [Corynebacterium phocae]KAA8725382.1 DNA polymerase IV [Corynebacterium phocae]
MQRWVIHIDMDAFYASVEQLTRPTLTGRPVLVGGLGGRGVVAGASYEARALGAHSAMPMYRAQHLVGARGVVIRPRREVYSAASRRVFSILARQGEVIERLSIDEGFMEPEQLRGASPREVRDWAENIRAQVREETGLSASIGAGSGKQFAKIGSGQAKPDGSYVIPVDKQLDMLHPLAVGQLWGVGPVTQKKLSQIGVETIGDLAAMTQKEVEISIGATVGLSLWEMARGIDDRPVAPRAIAKQISQEHTYARDLLTVAEVNAAISRAADGAHARLLKDGRGARTVTVKLRMADFHIESRSATLAYATDDLATLKATAFKIARYPSEVGAIRLVGVGFSGLESARQNVMFPELDQAVIHTEVEESTPAPPDKAPAWLPTQDVYHEDFGHGWIQGSGHGVVSVRFETRATGPGFFKSIREDDDKLRPGNPLDSLAWDEWLRENAED